MEWEHLISGYLDDALTPDEVTSLFRWIDSHPDNARRFARAVFLHRRLEHRFSAMRHLQAEAALGSDPHVATSSDVMPAHSSAPAVPNTQVSPESVPSKLSVSVIRWRFRGIAAAILLVIGVLLFIAWPRGSAARLLAAENAAWGADSMTPKQGDRLPKGPLVLNFGHIKLGFDNGNQLLIEGPARFSITDARAVTLDQGSLTATVTQAGWGLSVSTPAARVADLGSEFRVLATATATRVTVLKGKVSVDGGPVTAPRELSAGSAVEVSATGISPLPFEAMAFKRATPLDVPPLDLVDLIAGGDGMGSKSGVGIDAATGRVGETKAVTVRWGDRRYRRVANHGVLDGCLIPDGRMPVDSAGNRFSFPATSRISYGLIWSGPDIPWEGELPIATKLPQDVDTSPSRVLVMHSNNGLTLNLDAVRALQPKVRITDFRARVGNSYRPAEPGASPARPLASVHVIVDGVARFERRAFANLGPSIDVACALSDTDRFLTLATTDGGDGNVCDWVLWTHPEFVVQHRGQ